MTLIADVFSEVETPNNVARSMSKKLFFRRPCDRQHGKWVEKLLESERQHLHKIY